MSDSDLDLPPELFARAVATLAELTAISSPSGDAAGLERMAGRLAAELAARGLATEIHPAPAAAGATLPVLHAYGPSGAAAAAPGGAGALLLIGHMDTVLPAAMPRQDGDRLVATGAIDMKGGLATLLGALDLLAHRGIAPPPDLQLVVVPDEEVGGELSRAAVATHGATARALWVLEPGEPGSAPGVETVVGGRRGMFNWRLQVHGRAAHSGLHFADGRSALLAAARFCVAAADEVAGRRDRPDPVTDDSARHRDHPDPAIDDSADSRDRLGPATAGSTAPPTVNVGRLVAGDTSFVGDLATAHPFLGTERQLNVVPDRAVAEGELRFTRPSDGDAATAALADLAAGLARTTGTTLHFTRGATIPPVDPHGPQRALLRRAVALAAAAGWSLEIEEERGGISFPNFLPDPSRLPILDGLGPIGGGMHTRDEYLDLRSLRRRILLLATLLAEDVAAHR